MIVLVGLGVWRSVLPSERCNFLQGHLWEMRRLKRLRQCCGGLNTCSREVGKSAPSTASFYWKPIGSWP